MRVAVVGTGTDVGKSHVVACMLHAARRSGRRFVGYKPVATGVAPRCDDAELHAEASGLPVVPPTFAYLRPVSPHLAAREEGRPIDFGHLRARADELASGADGLLIEGVGGLFSPLGPTSTNVDLVLACGATRVVLVAGDRLGALHDVRAARLAAAAVGLPIDAVALSAPAVPDASTGTHEGELASLGLGPVAAVFPRASWSAAASLAAATALLRFLEKCRAPH